MPKGIRHGGRGKGTPNKATGKAREVIAQIADEMSPDFKRWLTETATGLPEFGVKPDPKGAATLYLAAIEYHIPKLARTELTGDPEKPINIHHDVTSKILAQVPTEQLQAILNEPDDNNGTGESGTGTAKIQQD